MNIDVHLPQCICLQGMDITGNDLGLDHVVGEIDTMVVVVAVAMEIEEHPM